MSSSEPKNNGEELDKNLTVLKKKLKETSLKVQDDYEPNYLKLGVTKKIFTDGVSFPL